MSFVSLVAGDYQWFKSKCGTTLEGSARDVSFCGHLVANKEPLFVEDALQDARFQDNPLVAGDDGIRFYAGYPLFSPTGHSIGSFCVAGRTPRSFDAESRRALADFAAIAQSEIDAVDIATRDELTGLNNRRGFEAFAAQALALCRRQGTVASLLFIDLDKFKHINDRLGHAAGDHALANFATCLRESFRDTDVLGRLGGDEFIVLMPGASGGDASAALRRFQARVARLNATAAQPYQLEFSSGRQTFHCADPAADLRNAMSAADTRMYRHKARRHVLAASP